MSDEKEPLDFSSSVEILTWLNEIGNPTTEALDFDACIGGNLKPEARDLLKLATAQRHSLQESLSYADAKVDPRNVVAAADSYLPSVWRITASMEASSDAQIKLRKKVEFAWTSQLSKKKVPNKYGVLVFEVAYTLMVRSIAHLDTAHALLQASKTDPNGLKIAEATQELRMGAGIQDYVSNNLLPRWINPPPKRPHEVLPQVVSTLSNLYLADAQRLAVAKAVISKSPASLITKLIIGCVSRYDMAIRVLRTLQKEDFESIHDCIRDELGTMPALLRALACKFMGIAAHEKEKWGQAAAFMAEAARRLDIVLLGSTMQKALTPALQAEIKQVKQLAHEYTEECTNVYFDAIPPASTLEFPDGTFIIKPVDYHIPDSELVSFAEEQPKPAAPAASAAGDASAAAASSSSAPETTSSYFKRTFFSSKKKEAASAPEPVKLPPGVDAAAFNALPEDIQHEILAQFQAEGGAATKV